MAVFGSDLQEKLGRQKYFLVSEPLGHLLLMRPLASGQPCWSHLLYLSKEGLFVLRPTSHHFKGEAHVSLFAYLLPPSSNDCGSWDLKMWH